MGFVEDFQRELDDADPGGRARGQKKRTEASGKKILPDDISPEDVKDAWNRAVNGESLPGDERLLQYTNSEVSEDLLRRRRAEKTQSKAEKARNTPEGQALAAADEFRQAILDQRIANRKRRQEIEQRLQLSAQAAARQRAGGRGFFQPKGGTILTGPLGAQRAQSFSRPVSFAGPPVLQQQGPAAGSPSRAARATTNFGSPTKTQSSPLPAPLSSRVERVRLAGSSKGGTFGRGV